MRRTLIAATAALLLAGSAAVAQSITLTPEIETEFRTFITTEEIDPVELDAEIAIGTPLPDTVVLQPVPDVIVTKAPELEGHRFTVVGGRVVLVEPTSTNVVAVID
jgi:hypothetical protein